MAPATPAPNEAAVGALRTIPVGPATTMGFALEVAAACDASFAAFALRFESLFLSRRSALKVSSSLLVRRARGIERIEPVTDEVTGNCFVVQLNDARVKDKSSARVRTKSRAKAKYMGRFIGQARPQLTKGSKCKMPVSTRPGQSRNGLTAHSAR
ncbi:hypothetical protein BCR37DRAFT_378194 [Protomyces lactucae-debilis]|uniref:Uncharacterized protein n=1 Tax=Protomyces lactucae-debilis TaxID=2754530 RepID=A0A1Y2FJR4_PROLT|nr:uncharacterized protein BCR37DRAFT_378194 [Protomyces lactucae-debilis]ORY84198.1 hypothetical protein BCR37DRAFT_378194 [Protomyces lactucae-debilis]